ncbi:MAG: hypothetical protein JNK01_18565 [Devosia sp.]|nr:hypothetical protein [Devosia sp.]
MIVEDICRGRKVEAFRHGPNPFSRKAERLQGQLCSMQFLGFLRTLRSMMREQRVFHLTPTRAAELLYNFDFAEESFTQPFMRLKLRSDACYYLVSTSEYEQRFGVRLRLSLGNANDATDWTLSPTAGMT